ncbi:MAG: hypothetical protein GWN01_16180 [Nitrosopumilaceae archaeon]|nr:hypothetical protein [Nitrosopumilaceae archaeon]NIU02375.1 hypothetical protein [Nitrosopumilaceae archaeon]NIU88832.1 hypothetical protein [Nitrosopumilaceae archaeon]NIV66956.1 hypothetical protein [Nitrosopumilaceae archaeon]NIX62976.1 hypothetical protein [Nitrosopumilaceae archaeon]
MKKIIVPGIAFTIIVISISLLINNNQEQPEVLEGESSIDVMMPTKSSRPGCEDTDSCYIPSTIKISAGESVTWKNSDSAFHSVTSGSYDLPDGRFDSGHMDPSQTFTVTFDEAGIHDYFCKLHPWMKGQVVVE